MLNSTFTIDSAFLLIGFINIVYESTFRLAFDIFEKNQKNGFVEQDFFSDKPNSDPNHWKSLLAQASDGNLQPYRAKIVKQKKRLSPKILKLDPKYVVGLTEAEGCFSIYYQKTDQKLHCEFTIALMDSDESIIWSFQEFFGVGEVTQRKQNMAWYYSVKSDWALYYSIIPFFEQHALLGLKRRDFDLLKETVKLKSETGLLSSSKTRRAAKATIAQWVYTYFVDTVKNRDRNLTLIELLSELNQPLVKLPNEYYCRIILWSVLSALTPFVSPHPWYVTGFCEGDGGSTVSFSDNKTIHTYHICSSQQTLLEMFQSYWRCGKIYKIDLTNQSKNREPRDHWRLLINPVADLRKIHDFHFSKYPMFCSKQIHYEFLIRVVTAVEKKEYRIPKTRLALFEESRTTKTRLALFEESRTINSVGESFRKEVTDQIILDLVDSKSSIDSVSDESETTD